MKTEKMRKITGKKEGKRLQDTKEQLYLAMEIALREDKKLLEELAKH